MDTQILSNNYYDVIMSIETLAHKLSMPPEILEQYDINQETIDYAVTEVGLETEDDIVDYFQRELLVPLYTEFFCKWSFDIPDPEAVASTLSVNVNNPGAWLQLLIYENII